MFLKRLENDGATISISKADRELLRNFSKIEEEIAEKDLRQAMEDDGAHIIDEDEQETRSQIDSMTSGNSRVNKSKSRRGLKSATQPRTRFQKPSTGRKNFLKKVSDAL